MAGKPAARMNDVANCCADPVDMPVGKVIGTGATVLINNMPAARMTDQVVSTGDIHIIMIPTPGGPVPTPLPHPFAGQILGDVEPTVMIMGQPAAVQGSTANAIPPHIPQGGPFQKPPMNQAKIMLGSPDVLIGGGSASGGAPGSPKAGTESVKTEAGEFLSVSWDGQGEPYQCYIESATTEGEEVEGHFLDVTFVDKGGKPISDVQYKLNDTDQEETEGVVAGGLVRKLLENEGDCDIALMGITSAAWSAPEAKTGEAVDLEIETTGIEDGAKVVFQIWERDFDKADKLLDTIYKTTISGDKAKASWTYEIEKYLGGEKIADWVDDDSYSSPTYYFVAEANGERKRSDALVIKTDVEIKLEDGDNDNEALEGVPCVVTASDGAIHECETDGDGVVKVEGLPPRPVKVDFAGMVGNLEGGATPAETAAGESAGEESAEEEKPEALADVIEFEDALFDYDSALLLPEGPSKSNDPKQRVLRGLDVFVETFKFLSQDGNDDKKLLIAGHTDAAGSAGYNAQLSCFRAQTVQYLLCGASADREAWIEQFKNKKKDGVSTYQPKDVQSILNWTQNYFGYPCGGLKVDGKLGTKSRKAIKAFKKAYNEANDLSSGDEKYLKASSDTVSNTMWGAVFDLYQAAIDEDLKAAEIERPTEFDWVDQNSKAVGCGELWPLDKLEGKIIDDSEYSKEEGAEDRRVELMFLDPDEADEVGTLKCNSEECTEDSCPIYGELIAERKFQKYIWELSGSSGVFVFSV